MDLQAFSDNRHAAILKSAMAEASASGNNVMQSHRGTLRSCPRQKGKMWFILLLFVPPSFKAMALLYV